MAIETRLVAVQISNLQVLDTNYESLQRLIEKNQKLSRKDFAIASVRMYDNENRNGRHNQSIYQDDQPTWTTQVQ